MNLDILGGIFTGWVAFGLGLIFAFSDKKRDIWMNVPGYVRMLLWITSFLFAIRSVNLFTLAPDPELVRGRINSEGLAMFVALAALVTAVSIWLGVFNRLPKCGWTRLNFAREQLKNGEAEFVVPMGKQEITAYALGEADTNANGILTKDFDVVQDPMAVVPDTMLREAMPKLKVVK